MARASTQVAVVLLVAVAVLAAGGLAVALPALPAEPPAKRAVDATATPDGRVALTLLAGPPVDVRDLRVRVAVGGESLRYQPPVPFFAARGFRGGPTGPFNVAADPTWTVGETASFRIAGTNRPALAAGREVRIRLVVRGQVVAADADAVG